MSLTAPDPVVEPDVRTVWTSPGFDLELDARLDGSSSVYLEDFGEGRVWIDVSGRPSKAILDWAVELLDSRRPR